MKKGLFKLILITGLASLLLVTGAVMAEENGGSPDSAPTPIYQKDELYFAQALLPKTRLYLGERVPLTIRLYVGEIRIDNVDPPDPQQPEFDFLFINSSQGKTEINGNPYRLIQFNLSLTPLKTGKLTINPVTLNCTVVQTVLVSLPSGETGRRIINRTLEVNTPKQTIQVLPLPQKGQPTGFSGGIGKLKLTLNPGSAVIRQGDSFTMKLIVSGTGNLSNIGAPRLEGPEAGLKVFPAQKTGEDRPGRREFQQVIIPLEDKIKTIGPFILDYFDPDAGKYRKATATLAVKIKANPDFQKGQIPPDPQANSKPAPEPAALKENPGDLRLGNQLFLNQLWFWLVQLVPLMAFLAAIYYRNYQRMLSSNSFQARAIKASRKSAPRLSAAKTLLEEGKSGQLMEELHLILREYLGEKFNLPVAGMTEAVVDTLKTMAPDLDPDILKQIHAFFTGYDARRFAGGSLQPEEGAGLWETVNGIIEALNRYHS